MLLSRFFCCQLLLIIPLQLFATPADHATRTTDEWVDHIIQSSDEEVEKRLRQLDQSIVEYRLDKSVRWRIRMYIENWRGSSNLVLGRTTRYFPYISDQLKFYGMPEVLKYLTITESVLRPFAISPAGAAGLWQLMPGTARELGLQVDETVDERLDITLGTEAGLAYLRGQYDRYGNWALAMAAYNSGPGRVNRAKRRSSSSNYWKLRRYLPRETRGYVPGFIAATYLATYFREHNLTPQLPELDVQLTETIIVNQELSLHRVAMVTGLRPSVVVLLNPAYLAGYLPARPEGRPLHLPRRVVPAMYDYLNNWHTTTAEPALPWLSPLLNRGETDADQHYQKLSTVSTVHDTSFQQMADLLTVAKDHLLSWSGYGPQDELPQDQWLTYYRLNEPMAFGEEQRPETYEITSIESDSLSLEPLRSMIITERKVPQPTIYAFEPAKPKGIKRLLSDIWEWISR
ncbi:MAG: lytic transglycosylase domain-containing protein [Bacteroidota bacterium]